MEISLEANFGAVLDAAPDAMLVVDHKAELCLPTFRSTQLFGYAPSELIGQKMRMLGSSSLSRQASGPSLRVFRGDPHVRPMGAGLTLHGLRKDGSEFPVEISLSPVDTPQGTMVISAIRDVTARRGAEDGRRALLESAPDAMVIVDETEAKLCW